MVDHGVWLVLQSSGAVIGQLPSGAASLGVDAVISYEEVGGSSVDYRVQRVQYVAQHSTATHPDGPDSYSVYGRIDLLVSVV